MEGQGSNAKGNSSPMPWEQPASGAGGPGATDIFAAPAAHEPAPDRAEAPSARSGFELPPVAERPFLEPVVHAVHTDASGQATSNILDQMKQASAARNIQVQPPAAPVGADPGFTQLVRTFHAEASPPAATQAAPSLGSEADRDASFSALLRTHDANEKSPAQPTPTARYRPLSGPDFKDEPRASAPSMPASSGFSELMRSSPASEAPTSNAAPGTSSSLPRTSSTGCDC